MKKLHLSRHFLVSLIVSIFYVSPVLASCLGPTKANKNIASVRSANNLKSRAWAYQQFDYSALNLKNAVEKSVVQTNTAITFSEADYNKIMAAGNSMVFSYSDEATFAMNIGTANDVSPQTWTLPSNFSTLLSLTTREDMLNPSSIPAALRIAGANRIRRSFQLDEDDNLVTVYEHYFIDNNGLNRLGTSYDLESGEDDVFDEPDYEDADVPLDIGDEIISTIDIEDYKTNLNLEREIMTQHVDAYGTISTPDGVFNCLRISFVIQTFTRPNEAANFTLQSTINRVAFVAKEGVLFSAAVSATNGNATLSNLRYRKTVLTSSLVSPTAIKLNNDNKGVTINSDNEPAHVSSVLEISSADKGVLIPRISKANRPSSPATGLLVYQVDNTPGFYYFDGSAWRILSSSASARVGVEETVVSAPIDGLKIGQGNTTSLQKGKGQLKGGTSFISFATIQESFEELVIQIQPEGDCNGLYVSKKTKEGFEVKELQKGNSNTKFTWTYN